MVSGTVACEIASVAAGAYLAVLWIGMTIFQGRVRSRIKSGDLVTRYDSYAEEPNVVRSRLKVAMYSVCAAAFATGAFLYSASRDAVHVYVSVACMIFFGGSYAVYAAWPDKPRFMRRLLVRPSDKPGTEPFDASSRASRNAHACAAVAALVVTAAGIALLGR